jgi:2-oxoglutarate ferredoxin oxidoreductase subunit gamma
MISGPLRHEVLISGFGGQGVVLAGKLLANAALMEGHQVVWAPSYGPEMRGGEVHCTVIISSQRIGSPEISFADTLMVMDRNSLQKFAHRVKPNGLMVLNSSLIPDEDGANECQVLRIPANQIAEEMGDIRIANVVMLGAFLGERPVISPASLEDAIRTVGGEAGSKPAVIELNIQAFARGIELARGRN